MIANDTTICQSLNEVVVSYYTEAFKNVKNPYCIFAYKSPNI